MISQMPNFFDDFSSDFLELDAYRADLRERRLKLGSGVNSWKLERRQSFQDATDPPWVAFSQGKWEKSIQLMNNSRALFDNYCKEARDHGVTLHRVRVVEEPVLPYVQWELHYLRLATSAGEKIRVVTTENVREFERDGQLPDIVTAGKDTVYRVLYTDEGVPEAARRIVNPEVANQCIDLIRGLYADGEEMESYFERAVANLTPPNMM